MCCVCVSRRGMVYFGASIHIFVTLILFLGSSFRAYRISSYEREENTKQFFGASVIATYFFTLLILGCLIFRGVEHKSPKMLGWSGGTFITLETFAFVFNLVLLSPMGGAYDEYGIRNFGFTVDVFQILLSLLFLGCMAGYCAAIILYILKLREDDTGSEYTYGEFDDAGTIPAPPVATNLSRSSTAHSNYSVHHNNKASNTQLTQAHTGSHGHINQCNNSNNQYHTGGGNQNHQMGGGVTGGTHKSSPILQDRRLQKVNQQHQSQDRLNESAVSYFLPQQQRFNPYASHAAAVAGGGGEVYANYTHQPQRGGVPGGNSGVVPYRQSQTLPHPHHYHRHLPVVGEGEGGLVTASTQFPSNSQMDLASLTQTLQRNSNMKRTVVIGGPTTGRNVNMSSDPRINPAIRVKTTFPAVDPNFMEGGGEMWEQPRVQALKYSYGGGGGQSSRKGITGSTIGIEV